MAFAPDYLGFPVWLPDARLERRVGQQSYGIISGETWQRNRRFAYSAPNEVLSFSSFAKTRAERWEVEEHFRAMRGREGLFWIPGFRDIFRLALPASAGGDVLDLEDEQGIFALNGIKRHVWFPLEQEPYEIGEAVRAGANVQVSVSPNLVTDKESGTDIWGLYLVRFSSDTLAMPAQGGLIYDDGAEVHDVAAPELGFVESQGNTPTVF